MYNKDNIEGIEFTPKGSLTVYCIIKNLNNWRVSRQDTSWSTTYSTEIILDNLNKQHWIVQKQLFKIHECW